MSEDLPRLAESDYASAALVCIHDARRELCHNRSRADEMLAVAQRLAIMAGAKDIGPLADGRDLSTDDSADSADHNDSCCDGDDWPDWPDGVTKVDHSAADSDPNPTCYACGVEIDNLVELVGVGHPVCPSCGENPLPPVGDSE